MTRLIVGAVGGAAVLLTLGACGSSASTHAQSSAPAAADPNSTAITLSEMKVDMQSTFKPGKYTFTISNTGTMQHELLVFKSDLTPDKYPTTSSGAIDEGGPGIKKISDGPNLDPGKSQTRVVDLSQPGSYLFVCNLPGHFVAGMYQAVTVSS
jgi:uncharacterized cupredoxin-like copper-binding protein